MMEVVRKAVASSGEEFPFEAQVALLNDQLALVREAYQEMGDGDDEEGEAGGSGDEDEGAEMGN